MNEYELLDRVITLAIDQINNAFVILHEAALRKKNLKLLQLLDNGMMRLRLDEEDENEGDD